MANRRRGERRRTDSDEAGNFGEGKRYSKAAEMGAGSRQERRLRGAALSGGEPGRRFEGGRSRRRESSVGGENLNSIFQIWI